MRNWVRFTLCAAVAAALLGGLGTSVAGATPNTTQYDNPSTTQPAVVKPSVVGSTKGAHATAKPTKPVAAVIRTTQPAKQGLPFTGQSLVTFFGVGALLLAAGLFLRLLGRRRSGV
jgi:asparagine N-glycosylation enzyme membrane subunit Stt3